MLAQVTAVEAVKYVEYPEFITVVIGVVSLLLGITAVIYGAIGRVRDKVNDTSERVAVTEKQNDGDDNNFKILFQKIDYLEKERTNDKIIYNDAINKLNMTLGKIETTLENNNTLVRELKDEWNRKRDNA